MILRNTVVDGKLCPHKGINQQIQQEIYDEVESNSNLKIIQHHNLRRFQIKSPFCCIPLLLIRSHIHAMFSDDLGWKLFPNIKSRLQISCFLVIESFAQLSEKHGMRQPAARLSRISFKTLFMPRSHGCWTGV